MKIAFFPGCVIPIRYPGIEAATRALAGRLDIDLVDLDFHCCPSPTGLKEASVDAWLALAVDNLCIAETQELDVVTICSGCGNTLREARRSCQKDAAKGAAVRRLLAPHGRHYRGKAEIFHLPDLLARDETLDRLEAACVRPLNGLRIATHYGCHYFRPAWAMREADASTATPLPESMELVLEALGAEIVEYGRQDLCCGASLNYNVGKGEESLQVLAGKLEEMTVAHVEAVVVPCPSCLTQFDGGQSLMSRKNPAMKPVPVYHIAELVAYALGADLKTLDGDRHKIKAPLLAV
jgi:heterodisulfide reductase subunit B